MNLWPLPAIETQLIRDTFRQARATGVLWMMLIVTGLFVALCLSVKISGDVSLQSKDETVWFQPRRFPGAKGLPQTSDPAAARREGVETIRGHMTLAFGAISYPLGRDRADAVHFLQLVLVWGIAGTFGVLLTLVWTAGFMPTFLERSAASVLLAKPVPRWRLLLGKYLGVLTFVGFQIVLFVVLTWLALGLRTGVWDMTYCWCIPLVLLQFAIFYSFSVVLAVLTRSTVTCVFGSLLFWLLGYAINWGTVMAHATPDPQALSSFTVALSDAAYWVSPKPLDAGLILFDTLDAQHFFEKPEVFKLLESRTAFSPVLSILSSLLITGGFLALSVYELNVKDY